MCADRVEKRKIFDFVGTKRREKPLQVLAAGSLEGKNPEYRVESGREWRPQEVDWWAESKS